MAVLQPTYHLGSMISGRPHVLLFLYLFFHQIGSDLFQYYLFPYASDMCGYAHACPCPSIVYPDWDGLLAAPVFAAPLCGARSVDVLSEPVHVHAMFPCPESILSPICDGLWVAPAFIHLLPQSIPVDVSLDLLYVNDVPYDTRTPVLIGSIL